MPTAGTHSTASRFFDELIADAWPPKVVESLGEWRLRWAWGITRRANSVLAAGDPGCALAEAVDSAEEFYGERGEPCRFQVSCASSSPALEEFLERRGYRREALTVIQTASASSVAAMPVSTEWNVRLVSLPGNAWLTTYWTATGRALDSADRQQLQERYRSTLLRPATETRFVRVVRGGISIAVGQVVAQGSWCAVQCMATLPQWRRRGAATAVLRAIGSWAQSQGISDLYLAVMDESTPARQLYARAGFGDVGAYAYWTLYPVEEPDEKDELAAVGDSVADALVWRRLRPSDVSAVRELHKLALHHAGAFADSDDARVWDRDFDDLAGVYLRPGGEFLVGVLGDRIIAMGALRLEGGGRGEIKRVRVHPRYQGRGLGRELLAKLETAAATAGVTTLALDTSTVQTAACHLFASAGYVEVHREHRGGLEMIFMQKTIGPAPVVRGQ